MIGSTVKKLLLENEADFLISAENVATLNEINSLEHALLVLTKIGYSRVPVLNKEEQLVGLVSLSQVVDQMFGMEDFEPQNLSGKKVSDVMDTNMSPAQLPIDLEKTLHLLVDNNFIPVVDENNQFMGIITRKEILKAVNHLAHELETEYNVMMK
ncbi:cyclic-di-AMP-binding protein CbpB [Vagococcus luciliae]|uniref:CBS domain-containing protein YkuL n=1 Tax=Vagococcus luciliae TaxID=2920380 RepID=A0ABY5P051_9ENTE|nr:cyclic-di-AMP-binding protein CbpB [Vagococcus luciliae]UUV99207.1 CBS domain-containing protein YkuL [Vagococcus luciliae]